MSTKPASFQISVKEEGRGRPSIVKFDTLDAASLYIEERWEGPEYIDNSSGFHTDYCTYILDGFTLRDIGTLGFDEGFRTFVFNPKKIVPPSPPFFIHEKNAAALSDKITHTFNSLDEAVGFIAGRWQGQESVSGDHLFVVSPYILPEETRSYDEPHIEFRLEGFNFSDIGTFNYSRDGEHQDFNLHPDYQHHCLPPTTPIPENPAEEEGCSITF